jgi:hypothetical protein
VSTPTTTSFFFRRLLKRLLSALLLVACGVVLSHGSDVVNASVPPTTTLVDEIDEQGTGGGGTDVTGSVPVAANTVPPSCFTPTPVQATFIGRLSAADSQTARFDVVQVRGGSLDGYAVATLVDVQYQQDVRFLTLDESYIVAVGIDQTSGLLYSKIRDPEPLYGGSQVVGLNSGVTCPEVEDAVRTLTMDGRSVESGVLAPLKNAKGRLGRAILLPFLWVFGGLLGLATVRAFVVTVIRSGKRAWNGE